MCFVEPDGMPVDSPQLTDVVQSIRRDPFYGSSSRELSEELDRRVRVEMKSLVNENERLIANIGKLYGRIDRLRFLVALMRNELPEGKWSEEMQNYWENIPHEF